MSDKKNEFDNAAPGCGAKEAARMLKSRAPVFAATVGLDGRPQVRSAEFAFERDGALYFVTEKSRRFYAELSKTPFVQFIAAGGDPAKALRVSGKAVFTEEDETIDRCIEARPELTANTERKALIAFFLTGASAQVFPLDSETAETELELPDPEGVLIGITIRKKTELRERLERVLQRREQEPAPAEGELLKLYDGALFVFAGAAKALWPRMNVTPIERAACFETWDERERYTNAAARLIGNAVIASPEDITYWLNAATLNELIGAKRV